MQNNNGESTGKEKQKNMESEIIHDLGVYRDCNTGVKILLMEEILHHLKSLKSRKWQ